METNQPTKIDSKNFRVGITPGETGGVATCIHDVFACQAMPPTAAGLLAYLRALKQSADLAGLQPLCRLEQTERLRFQDAERFGVVLGVLQALDFRIELVRPADWEAPLRGNAAPSTWTTRSPPSP